MEPKRIYLDSRRLAWFAAVSLVLLMGASLWLLGKDSVPVIAIGLPSIAALTGGYAGIDRRWGRLESGPKETPS